MANITYLPQLPFDVYCANDKGRPNEIPESKWVKEGEWYIVTSVIKCNIQRGTLAFVLSGIDLSDCQPYQGFDYRRFRLPLPDSMALDEEQDMLNK